MNFSLNSKDGFIRVVFPLSNFIRLLQPTDQHIIRAVKMQYKKRPLYKVLSKHDCAIMIFGDLFLKEINLKYVVFFHYKRT